MGELESSLRRLDSMYTAESERDALRRKVLKVASLFPDGWEKSIALGRIEKGLREAPDAKVSEILKALRE